MTTDLKPPAVDSEWRHRSGWTMTVLSVNGTSIVVNSKHDGGFECRDVLQIDDFYDELTEVVK